MPDIRKVAFGVFVDSVALVGFGVVVTALLTERAVERVREWLGPR